MTRVSRKEPAVDTSQFDRWARTLADATTRRGIVHGLAGTALGLAVARLPDREAAGKTRKRQKPKRNAYGCLDVGKACGGRDRRCCSGICRGKKPKKGERDARRCAAHDVAGCQAGQNVCGGPVAQCGTGGTCTRTTGNAGFCGSVGGMIDCVACQKDADCDEATFGPGAACVVCDACPATGNSTRLPSGA